MPRHRGPPGQGRPRWGWEQRLDSFLRVPSLRLLSMGLALTLALSDPLVFWAPAGAHPLPAQGHPAKFSRIAPQLRKAFGWWNLSCPVCKGLFTALDLGLKVSALGAAGRGGGRGAGRRMEGRAGAGAGLRPSLRATAMERLWSENLYLICPPLGTPVAASHHCHLLCDLVK